MGVVDGGWWIAGWMDSGLMAADGHGMGGVSDMES